MNLDKEFCHLVGVFKCEDADKAWDYLISYAYNNDWIENSDSITPDEFLFAYSQIGVEGDPQLEHMTISETELSKNADTTFKKISKSMISQAITSKNVYNAVKWLYDKTQPAPLEAVTYWKNHIEEDDYMLIHNDIVTNLEDVTLNEVKAKVQELIDKEFEDPLIEAGVVPVEYDEKGGLTYSRNLSEADDDDTFMVTDSRGISNPVDGKEKALEKSIQIRKDKIDIGFGFTVFRKITEPDGYFAWRQENRADYL